MLFYHIVPRKFRCTSILLVVLFLMCCFSSCKNEHLERQIHSLDSLNGALNQKLNELKSTDTITLHKAITRYNDYKRFIQQNISDTISKNEADGLQQFYNCGASLMAFEQNRKAIIARGNLISSQLDKLAADVKNSSESAEYQSHFENERANAVALIRTSVEQQKLFAENLQEFKLSLKNVESFIKSRNNGLMPTVVKDSIPF